MHGLRRADDWCINSDRWLLVNIPVTSNHLKYNIDNDVDLIKFIRNRKKKDCSFITPVTSIKENYFFNYIETVLPDLDTITYLEGDLEGYMFETDNYKQACIIKDDKLYCITFYKLNYFDDEKIQDILNSLIIEK